MLRCDDKTGVQSRIGVVWVSYNVGKWEHPTS